MQHTWTYHLSSGHTPHPESGACAMDAINWLVHGQHGDRPVCVDTMIRELVVLGNDAMPDSTRQQLIPFLHRIAGSRPKSVGEQVVVEKARCDILYHALDVDFVPFLQYFTAKDALRELKMWWGHDLHQPLHRARTIVWAVDICKRFDPTAWNIYFRILDRVLKAGPEGEPWSVDVVEAGLEKFRLNGGKARSLEIASTISD